MNLNELKELIAGGETERVEFKRSTGQRTHAAKTVCAMLNGLGGFVVFGVTDKGELLGQQVSAKTLEDLSAELRKIEPPAFPDIETVHLKGDLAAIVLTCPGGGGPYTFDRPPLPSARPNHHPQGIRSAIAGTPARNTALGERACSGGRYHR